MNTPDFDDLDVALRGLACHDVDARRAARTLDHCLAALAKKQQRPARWTFVPALAAGRFLPCATVVLALAYLAASAQAAMALLRLR
jgi:hypothetical protein